MYRPYRAVFHSIMCGLWFASLIVIPATRTFAQNADESNVTKKKGISRLHATVHDSEGNPLPDALVRIAIPKTDMRFVDSMTGHKLVEAKTNENGDCFIEVPGLDKPTAASLDALLPGYRRLVGTLMMGGDEQSVELRFFRSIKLQRFEDVSGLPMTGDTT